MALTQPLQNTHTIANSSGVARLFSLHQTSQNASFDAKEALGHVYQGMRCNSGAWDITHQKVVLMGLGHNSPGGCC